MAVSKITTNAQQCTVPFGLAHVPFDLLMCPSDLLMCPLTNTTEAKCALWKAVKVVTFQSLD